MILKALYGGGALADTVCAINKLYYAKSSYQIKEYSSDCTPEHNFCHAEKSCRQLKHDVNTVILGKCTNSHGPVAPSGSISRLFCYSRLCVLLLSDYIKNKVPKNFPPGPWSLPIIRDQIHLQLEKFAKTYGNILSIRILGPRIVVLIEYKAVKEVYLAEGDNLADRPKLPIFYDLFGDKVGIIRGDLHSQLFETLDWERKAWSRPSILNEAISSENGQPFNPHILLNNAFSNVICVLVFGQRFEYSDNDFQTLLKKISVGVVFWGSIWAQLYNMFPWLMWRVPGPHQKMITLWREVIDFIQGKVNAHRVDYDPSNPRDYIDCFLAEMEKPKDDTNAGFDEETLCFSTLDLFIGGTETASTTLYWGLLYMMKYSEIQAKVQEEIDRVVGGSRQPSLSDKDNMPYTNAVIHEIQRIGNIVPINLVRSTVKETQIGKYFIPKGTAVIGSLTSVLFDESEWETPHSFNPGHFLDAEGKFRRRDAFLPFSLGKRVCLGEQLARMELFLFFSSLLQYFTFSSQRVWSPAWITDWGPLDVPYHINYVQCHAKTSNSHKRDYGVWVFVRHVQREYVSSYFWKFVGMVNESN